MDHENFRPILSNHAWLYSLRVEGGKDGYLDVHSDVIHENPFFNTINTHGSDLFNLLRIINGIITVNFIINNNNASTRLLADELIFFHDNARFMTVKKDFSSYKVEYHERIDFRYIARCLMYYEEINPINNCLPVKNMLVHGFKVSSMESLSLIPIVSLEDFLKLRAELRSHKIDSSEGNGRLQAIKRMIIV